MLIREDEMNTIFIVLPILTLLMFDLGLALKPADFQLIAERPKPVIIGLVVRLFLTTRSSLFRLSSTP